MSAIYLGVDTATLHLALALCSAQGEVLASFRERVEREHASRFVPELAALFTRASADKRALAGICVGLGPGSYTGLRVGLASALGLSRGLGIPLGGRTTLEAIAAEVLEPDQRGTVALDARRGNVYASLCYKDASGRVTTLTPPHKCSRDDLGPGLYFENEAPDAGYLARCAAEGETQTPSAIYL